MRALEHHGSLFDVAPRRFAFLLVLTLFGGCSDSPEAAASALDTTRHEPFAELDAEELRRSYVGAHREARVHGTHVLLVFLAPWCQDCRRTVELLEADGIRRLIEAQYELVFIDVGHFDQHREFLVAHEVERVATLVVLTPEGDEVARTTLEQLSHHRGLSAEALAEWLEQPRDFPDEERGDARDSVGGADEPQVFPAEL